MNNIFINNKPKILKQGSFIILAAALIVSGFFITNSVLAAANVTPASGGIDISIDTTSASGGIGEYKTLSGPAINETEAEDIAIGIHTITLPSGWEFDTGSTIDIFTFGGDIVLEFTNITPDQTSFSFNIANISTSPSVLGFSGLKVRPTGIVPSTNNMTYSGTGIVGVDQSTNFGTLSTIYR